MDFSRLSIGTNRLDIRPPLLSDVNALNQALVESHASLSLWMRWSKTVPTLADTENYIVQSLVDIKANTRVPLLIFDKNNNVIGGIALNNIKWDVPTFEVGYWLRTSFEKQGYMTEAVNAIRDYFFNNFNTVRLEIQCDEKNIRSRKVAERCKFTLEGILTNSYRGNDGTLRNICIYAFCF